ncbi:hypothetical protein BV20DRAFT_1050548 [Pilatotrama ljubarskyi]|nr:hypothetical protein BV20DRAFT_1050548 [Pilatotrama ljubarskyi]
MKIAQLRARLNSTLDELDAQRLSHQRELKVERNAKEKLSSKLDRYLDEVKRAERERDDMREMVSIVLDKEPVDEPDFEADRSQAPPAIRDDVSLAIVALLQKQLTEEKRAHGRTKESADAEILRLEAMVARREAELETCAVHGGHRTLLSPSMLGDNLPIRTCTRPGCVDRRGHVGADPALPSCRHGTASDIEAGETKTILARTASRSRVLEREVELLRQKLRQALHRPSSPEATSDDAASRRPTVPERRHVSVEVQADERELQGDRDEDLPPSPGLLPYMMPSSPSPYSMTPRHALASARGHPSMPRSLSGPTQPSTSLDAHVEGFERDIGHFSAAIGEFALERAAHKAMLARELLGGVSLEAAGKSHQKVNAASAAHLNSECARERRALREQLLAEARERARREADLQAEILSLKEALLEVRRDHAARPPLQQEEDGARAAAHARVSGDLKAPSVPSPRASPTLVPHDARASPLEKDEDFQSGERVSARVPAHQDISAFGERGDADELGEQSMELSTPLQTTILSLRDEDWPIPPTDIPVDHERRLADAERADVPVLTSSGGQFAPLAWPVQSPSSPTAPSSGSLSPSPPPLPVAPPRVPMDLLARLESATQERVVTIEREIAATQRELEHKEAALANLRITAAQMQTSQLSAGEAIPRPRDRNPTLMEGGHAADDPSSGAGSP